MILPPDKKLLGLRVSVHPRRHSPIAGSREQVVRPSTSSWREGGADRGCIDGASLFVAVETSGPV